MPFLLSKSDHNGLFFVIACHFACKGGCDGPTPKQCVDCKKGWLKSDDEGCLGIERLMWQFTSIYKHLRPF